MNSVRFKLQVRRCQRLSVNAWVVTEPSLFEARNVQLRKYWPKQIRTLGNHYCVVGMVSVHIWDSHYLNRQTTGNGRRNIQRCCLDHEELRPKGLSPILALQVWFVYCRRLFFVLPWSSGHWDKSVLWAQSISYAPQCHRIKRHCSIFSSCRWAQCLR